MVRTRLATVIGVATVLVLTAGAAATGPTDPGDGDGDMDGTAAAAPATPAALGGGPPLQTGGSAPQVGWGVQTVYGTTGVIRTGGGEGVTVAVIDTGVDTDHPDLRRRIVGCRDTTGGGVARGSCGDTVGHGTGVAGVLAADGGPRGGGLWGVAPDADIIAYRACDSARRCRQESVGRAVDDAVAAGADVIVLSLGNAVPRGITAVGDAASRGVLVVAASGNEGPAIGSLSYPAGDDDVVGVGAVEQDRGADGVAASDHAVPDFSSRGADRGTFAERDGLLEVGAPGVGVVTTAVGGGYRRSSGTSYAAPFVAGLAARLWPRVPDEGVRGKHDDVRRALQRRAAGFDVTRGRHAGRGYDPAAGIGVPQARPPRPAIAVDPDVPTRGEPATLRADDRRDAADADADVRYTWRFRSSDGRATGEEVTHVFGRHGRVPVELRAEARDGTVVETTRTVHVNAPPTASFGHAPHVPLAGAPVELDGRNSSDQDGTVSSYGWRLGDGASLERGGAVATARFERPGRRLVGLTVTDDDGASASAERPILVNDRPAIVVEVPEPLVAGEPAALRATVTDEVGAVAVRWRLPDGSTAVGPNATVNLSVGRHEIAVAAEDEYGATSNRTVTVEAVERRETEPPSGFPQPAPVAAVAVALALVAVWMRRR